MSNRLKVKIGKPAAFEAVVRRDAQLVSLAGASLWFTAKLQPGTPDTSAVFQLTRDAGILVVDETACRVRIEISGAQSALLAEAAEISWDLQVKYADGWEGIAVEGVFVGEHPVTAAN